MLSDEQRRLIAACCKDSASEAKLLALFESMRSRDDHDSHTRESEIRFQSLVAAMSEGVVVHDASGQITLANRAAQRILGLSEDQIMGRTPTDPDWYTIRADGSPFPGDEHPAMITLKTGIPQRGVIMGVSKASGELTWISINSEPMLQPPATKPYAVAVSFTDITELKAVEYQYREMAERLAVVIKGGQLGTWEVNLYTGQAQFNRRWYTMLGYTPAEIEEDLQTWFSLVHPDDTGVVADQFRTVRESDLVNFEYRLRMRDGDWRWVLAIGRLLAFDEEGLPLRAAGVHIDIHERKLAEARLHALQLEKERMQILVRFIRDISHEVRTPLSMITMNAMLMYMSDDPLARLEQRSLIDKQVKRLNELVAALVMLARLDSGTPLNITPVALRTLLVQVVADFDNEMNRKGQQYLIIGLEDAPIIEADAYFLREALKQAIDNAIRYSPAGATWRLDIAKLKGKVSLRLCDEGAGIPPEKLADVFRRFERHETPHAHPGIGVGLTIIQSVVERHRGTVSLESEVGNGTCLTIVLPAEQADIPPATDPIESLGLAEIGKT